MFARIRIISSMVIARFRRAPVLILLLNCEKLAKDIITGVRQKTFRVELHAEEWVLAVSDAHDLAVAARLLSPGGDFEFFGERIGLDYETVVARSLEWVVETCEEAL